MSTPQYSPLPSTYTTPSKSSLSAYLTEGGSIAVLIEQLLDRACLTQMEAASLMGVTPQALSQYVRNKRPHPSVQWLARLCGICGAKLYIEFPSSPEA